MKLARNYAIAIRSKMWPSYTNKKKENTDKWNVSKIIKKNFYKIALQKRALWLINLLAPFARRLYADVS